MPRKAKALTSQYQELFDKLFKSRFDAAMQEYGEIMKKGSRRKKNVRLAEIRDKFYSDAKEQYGRLEDKSQPNQFLQALLKRFEEAPHIYEKGKVMEAFIEEDLPKIRQIWRDNLTKWSYSPSVEASLAIDAENVIKMLAEYHALIEAARTVQADLNAISEIPKSSKQLKAGNRKEWWTNHMPTCPNRSKNDNYTNLSSEQTLLLFWKLREHKVLVSEDYQGKENFCITMGLLTNYSPNRTRQLKPKEVQKKKT